MDSFYDVDLKPAPNPPAPTIIPKPTITPYPKDVSYDPKKRNLEVGYEFFTEKHKEYYFDKIYTYYRINGGEKIKIHELSGYEPSFINIYKGNLYFCMSGSVYCYSNGNVSSIINLVSPTDIKDMFCYRDHFVILAYVDKSDHSQYSPYLSSSELDELCYYDSAFLAIFTMDGKKVKELNVAHGRDCLDKVKTITSINQSGHITY